MRSRLREFPPQQVIRRALCTAGLATPMFFCNKQPPGAQRRGPRPSAPPFWRSRGSIRKKPLSRFPKGPRKARNQKSPLRDFRSPLGFPRARVSLIAQISRSEPQKTHRNPILDGVRRIWLQRRQPARNGIGGRTTMGDRGSGPAGQASVADILAPVAANR